MVLPTAVKVGNGGDPDKSEKWLTAADVHPVKLSLMDTLQPVENRDGMPLKKNLEAWLANHSGSRRKSLSLTSFSALKKWCSFENFESNFASLATVVQADFEASVRLGCRSVDHAAMDVAVAKRLPPMLRMIATLREHIKVIAVAVSQRLLEIEIDPEVEVGDLQDLLKIALSPNSEKVPVVLELLKKGDKFKLLQGGNSVASLSVISPLQGALPSSEGPPSPTLARQLQFDNQNADSASKSATSLVEEAGENDKTGKGSRKRVATAIYEPDTAAKKSKGAKAKVPAPKANCSDSKNSESGPTRAYTKSGLYSRDPIKAAMAREKLGLPPAAMPVAPAVLTAGPPSHLSFPRV